MIEWNGEKDRYYFLMIDEFKSIADEGVIKLNRIMDSIEEYFRVPALRDEQYNKAYPEVIQLYREISDRRVF